MAQSGGEVAAKPTNLSPSGADAGEDRLSALPDDILVLILLRLRCIAEAARTCVLSLRWRRIWTLLPELKFLFTADYHHIREVLAAPEAPALRRIFVVTDEDAPDSLAAWLPLAARRLSGGLQYVNLREENEEEEVVVDGVIPLPCFGNATTIVLRLRYFALTLPSSGTFTRLTNLCLERARFQGTCDLGDIVSSPRCPCLRQLHVRLVQGVARLTVHSDSLLEIDLSSLYGLQHLNIDAPVLNKLALRYCFMRRNQEQRVANISAPQLLSLTWMDVYDPSYVHLGNLGKLQQLCPDMILVYEHPNGHNREVLRLLQRFQVIHSLNIALGYPQGNIDNFQYLMENITRLPHVTFLTLYMANEGHGFGASSFHVLRLCTGIRKLSLDLRPTRESKAQLTCPSGCICDQPTNWKIEKLSLNGLQEVEITNLKGAEHEALFLKRLLNWAGVLEKLRITFDYSVSEIKAKEFCLRLSSIFRPEIIVEFYEYLGMRLVNSLLLEDEGTGV